ncbi:hypothetical protein SAMN05421663_104167 [Terribacillus halophilus]|uniref:Uncharacterized protein n=1 Tax=Terribacillus halophilus TaxID=361279 RepID=A0A1G6PL97_9BACI|nr:hypothetical protein [Terribacillus halophilus]SDC80731.1 hypothetical protein SAMN05421663_104167 [Terribacillus halophilus]
MNKSNQEILKDIEQKMIANLLLTKGIINKMKSFNDKYSKKYVESGAAE